MGTVDAPYPSRVEETDGKSILTVERTATQAIIRNRAGQIVSTMTVKNTDSNLVKAIRRIGDFSRGYRDTLIRDFYRPNRSIFAMTSATNQAYIGASFSWEPGNNTFFLPNYMTPLGSMTYHTESPSDPNAFTQLLGPDYTTSFMATGLTHSPDGRYMVATSTSASYSDIFQYPGGLYGPTRLASTTIPTHTVGATQPFFSPDGLYLVIGLMASPWVAIYKRPATDSHAFARLANLPSLSSDQVWSVAWSPDMTYLFVGTYGSNAPFLHVYKRNGDIFEKQAAPASVPASGVRSLSMTADGQYLACSTITAGEELFWYKTNSSGALLTKQATVVSPGGYPSWIEWSPDGRYLAVAIAVSPYLVIYKREGSQLVKIPAANVPAPAGIVRKATWSPDGKYLGMCCDVAPWHYIYRSAFGPVAGAAIRGDTPVALSGGISP